MVHEAHERKAPAAAERPLWLFLSEPGLVALLVKELKHRDIVRQKARAQTLRLRNYDLAVFPESQITGTAETSRIALDALVCPVFGRHRISERQLDRLARAAKANRSDGLVSSVAGTAFSRQDVMRWLDRRLRERGLDLSPEAKRPIRLFIVDESFYFGFPRFNWHEAEGRERSLDRHGSLPPPIAAAMCFAANPRADEVVWDPVAGTGTLLSEAAAVMPRAVLIGSDLDEAAIKIAGTNLAGNPRAVLRAADSAALDLERTDLTLTLANLPFGKQFKAGAGNARLYEDILRRALLHAAPNWRACLLTSDEKALEAALASIGALSREAVARVRIRGHEASIFLVRRIVP